MARLFDRDANPKIVDAFEYLAKLYRHSRKSILPDFVETEGWLANREVWLSQTWEFNLMNLRLFEDANHLRLHPNFSLAGPDGRRPIMTDVWVLAVPKTSPHPQKAKDFIRLLMEARMQAMAMATESKIYTGGIPARADALDLVPAVVRDWFDLTEVEGFKLTAFKNFVVRPQIPYYASLSRLMRELYRSIVVEGAQLERALDLAQADLELISRPFAD